MNRISLPAPLREKCRGIERALQSVDRLAVAFSGGVDSTFVAWFAREILGKTVIALFADTPFVSAKERREASATAERLRFDLEVVAFAPLALPEIAQNPVDRCYRCKKELFGCILARAGELGCPVVADGTHAGDAGAYRPGQKALAELGILSPLALAGLVKEDVRLLSRSFGLPNWNKPSQSCLATRFPYGTKLSHELLRKVERAEDFLYGLGCFQVRVRCHGDLVRIEVAESDFPTVLSPQNKSALLAAFGELGFSHVCLDLAGFRSGSWDGERVADGGCQTPEDRGQRGGRRGADVGYRKAEK